MMSATEVNNLQITRIQPKKLLSPISAYVM